MSSAIAASKRFLLVFILVFVCYQAAEGIGVRLLNSAFWQAIFMLGTIPLALLLGWLFYRAPLGTYALEVNSKSIRLTATTFALALSTKAMAVFLGHSFGIYDVEIGGQFEGYAVLQAAVLILFMTFIPSLAEDILTRGLLLRHGPIRRGIAFVMFSTIVYVLNHIYRLGNGPMEWLLLTCFGIAYATACIRTDSLWAAVGLHWGWNAANGLLPLTFNIETHLREQAILLSAGMHLALAAMCLVILNMNRHRESDVDSLTTLSQ